MAVNTALINASFRLGASKAAASVPNMKSIYEGQAAIQKSVLGSIKTILDSNKQDIEQQTINKEKQLQPFKQIIKKGYRKLYEQKETMPSKVVSALRDEIKTLQEEFELVNTTGENDTEENEIARERLSAELQKAINQAVNTRANFMKIGGRADDLNEDEIGMYNIAPLTKAMDLDNIDNDPNTDIDYINGKLTWTVSNYYSDGTGDPISMTVDNMDEMLPGINKEWDSNELDAHIELRRIANNDGKDYTFNFEKEFSNISDSIKTEDDFRNITSRRIKGLGMKSFKEALLESPNIAVSVIEKLIDTNLDKDGDNFITEKDTKGLKGNELQEWKNEFNATVDALTNIKNPAFSLTESRKLISEYYADGRKQEYDDVWNRNNPPAKITPEKDLTTSQAKRDNIMNAWTSGNIEGLSLPSGHEINSDGTDYIVTDINGKEKFKFKTPTNKVLQRIMSEYGILAKDMIDIDFKGKDIFNSKDKFDPNN